MPPPSVHRPAPARPFWAAGWHVLGPPGWGGAVMAVVLATVDPGTARAQEDELPARCPSQDPGLAPDGRIGPVEYRDALRRGVDYRRERRDAAARAVFRDTYVRAGTAQALAQLALAEQALGESDVAAAHLREALACEDDGWILRHRSLLAAELERIGAAVAAPPRSADPTTSGPTAGPTAEEAPQAAEASEALAPATADLASDAGSPAIPEPPPPADTDASRDRRRVASIGLLSAGAALVVAGGVTLGLQRRAQRDLENACPDRRACDRPDLHDRARRLAAATDVLLVSGLSGLAVGVLVRLLPGRPSDEEAAAEATTDVSVACGPRACGLRIDGTF